MIGGGGRTTMATWDHGVLVRARTKYEYEPWADTRNKSPVFKLSRTANKSW